MIAGTVLCSLISLRNESSFTHTALSLRCEGVHREKYHQISRLQIGNCCYPSSAIVSISARIAGLQQDSFMKRASLRVKAYIHLCLHDD